MRTNSKAEITYDNLLNLGFIDPANNGCGCRIEVDKVHEICWYLQDNTVRYQTKGSGFSRLLYCQNIEDVRTLYRLLTGKTL